MASALRWRLFVLPLLFAAVLAAQAPETEDYFDRQSEEGDLVDDFELLLFDRIVRFPRRTDAVQLVAFASVDWYGHEARRGVGWRVQLAFSLAFDAFLVPSPRVIGAPRLERTRQNRCLQLAVIASTDDPIGRRALRAKRRALGCEATS